MIGGMAGDIIGSIYEHDPIKSTDFPLFGFGCRFTDDTVLTAAVAESLLTNKDYARCFEDWYYRFPNAGYGSSFAQWASGHEHKPYFSYGNGSAMRVGPIGWAKMDLEETLVEAEKSAQATHNHPEGIKGAQAIAAAIFLARHKESKEAIEAFIHQRFGYWLQEPLFSVRTRYKFDVTCQGTVPHAIRAFLESTDFENAIRLAISLGGDSDTLACITGSIAEAYYGVPQEIEISARRRLPEEILTIIDAFKNRFVLLK